MRARGFSLVELMVAITLALVVTAGVISVFVGSRSAFESTSGTAALTDGGRFALDFISNSVRGAGFMSCTTAPNIQGILNNGATPMPYAFATALGGYEANNTGFGSAYAVALPPVAADNNAADWVGGLDGALSGLGGGLGGGAPVRNNDVLVVRSTIKNAQTVFLVADGPSSFTVNRVGSLAVNQIAVVSDCSKGVVFQITNLAPAAQPIVTHNAGGGPPGNSISGFPFTFSGGEQVTPVDTLVYFIAPGADKDSALWVYDINGIGNPPTELVPDIEAMQVLYGLDTTPPTQTVSAYVTANQVADFNTVLSVKVALLAASAPGSARLPAAGRVFNLLGTSVTAPIDTRSRQVFQETIAVRNALP